MLWFAQHVHKYLDGTVESYCKSVDTADFYILSGQMDLTYSLDTLLILCTAISCLFLIFQNILKTRASLLASPCGLSVTISTRLFQCPGTVSRIDPITWADTKFYTKSYNQGTDSQHYQTPTGNNQQDKDQSSLIAFIVLFSVTQVTKNTTCGKNKMSLFVFFSSPAQFNIFCQFVFCTCIHH